MEGEREMDEKLVIAWFELAAAAAERFGVFLVMFCWLPSNVWVFLNPAIFLFGLSIMLYLFVPELEKLLFLDPQKYSEDENSTDKAKDEKNEEFQSVEESMYKEKSEILLEEILKQKLENKNQVVKEFEEERKKHEEERREWEREKTRCLQWKEERSQLIAELAAARASLQHYQELMHFYDNYY